MYNEQSRLRYYQINSYLLCSWKFLIISTNLNDSAKGPLNASDKTKLSIQGVTTDLIIIYKEPL